MRLVIVFLFFIQFVLQMALRFGWIDYKNTTPMYEDLITTMLFCTLVIVFALHEVKDKKDA